MAKIGDLTLQVASVSEDVGGKLSTHEVAIHPHTYGEIYKFYTAGHKWSLSASETAGFNIGAYRRLERLMKIGKSVAIDLPEIGMHSVGFITGLKLSKVQDVFQEFQIDLEEGLRNYIHGCDDTDGWTTNGTLALDTAEFKEGTGSVRCSGSLAAGATLRATAPITIPPRFLSCDWIAFWFRTNNITDLTSIVVRLMVDASNHASITVTGQVTAIDRWFLIRFKREACTITGVVEWDRIAAAQIEKTHSTAQTHAFWLDEICAMQ